MKDDEQNRCKACMSEAGKQGSRGCEEQTQKALTALKKAANPELII